MKITCWLLLLFSLPAQAQIESDILTRANESIKQLKSIKYNVTEIASYGSYTAEITSTRDKPYPLFGVSKIKVTGLAVNNHGSQQIQYASNGNSFQFFDFSQNKVIQMDDATDRKIFRTPMGMYLLLPVVPYWNEDPFINITKQLKTSREVSDTIIFGETAIKTQVAFETKNFDGSPMVLSSFWYFRKSDNLIVGHVSSTSKKFLKIKETNKNYSDAEFSLINAQQVEKITGNEPTTTGLLPVGERAPDFVLTSPTIGEFSLSENKGKVILLDFWGTWCVPCIKAMPEIQKISDHFKGKDVLVIGVSVEERLDAKPQEFMIRKGFTYPIVIGGAAITAPYKVMIFPSVYIIDKEGVIIHSEHGMGRENFSNEIIEKITKALNK